MKLAVLGEGSTCSLLLQHHEINILLDCSAEPTLAVLPSSQQRSRLEDSSTRQLAVCLRIPDLQRFVHKLELHAVLVSNPHALLAVPYLQQLLQLQGSRLPLHFYCTEPCYHSFQHLAQEILLAHRTLQKQQQQQKQKHQQQHDLQQQPMPQQLQSYQQQMQLYSQQLLAQQQQQHIPVLHHAALALQLQHLPGAPGTWQQQQQQAGFVPSAATVVIPPPCPLRIRSAQPPAAPPAELVADSMLAGIGDTTAAAAVRVVPPPRPPPVKGPQRSPEPPPAASKHSRYSKVAGAAAAAGQVGPPAGPLHTRPPEPPTAPSTADNQHNTAAPAAAAAAEFVPLFTEQQLEAVLNALQIVRYGQRLQLPGYWGLTAEARPAGSSIGSAVWLLTAGNQRITYLSPASLHQNHSAALHKPSLQNLDALILGPGSLCAELACLGAPQLLQAAAHAAAAAVLHGGRVLLPVLSSGSAVLQLMEAIPQALVSTAGSAAAAAVRFFYLSPAAADALATASSCCEYLEPARKQTVLVHAQAPFEHDRLLQAGQLTVLDPTETTETLDSRPAAAAAAAADTPCDRMDPAAADAATTAVAGALGSSSSVAADHAAAAAAASSTALQEVLTAGPCIVLVPLWSMAAGVGHQLAEQWCSDPKNLLLLPEQGPLSATWLQHCVPAAKQTPWLVLYRPVNSTAAAAAGVGRLSPSSRCGSSCGNYPVVEGCLTARQLLHVILAGQQQQQQQQSGVMERQQQRWLQLLLSAQDRQLLESAAQADGIAMNSFCNVITLLPSTCGPSAPTDAGSITDGHRSSGGSSDVEGVRPLSFQLVDLPEPLLAVQLSQDVAKSLQLTPVTVPADIVAATATAAATAAAPPTSLAARNTAPDSVQCGTTGQTEILSVHIPPHATHNSQAVQVSVARVRALLTHQAGAWRLEPLPGGTKPEAVAAAMDLLQQGDAGMMLFGSVELTTLLKDLQEAGFSSVFLDSSTTTREDDLATEVVRSVKVATPQADAEIWLLQDSTEVVCDSWALRKQLTELVLKQLQVIR